MTISRWLFPGLVLIACLLVARPPEGHAEEDVVRITSRVSYDVRPDQGPVRVFWDVTFQNNDPQTTSGGDGETEFFYQNLTIPVLRGASAISATSSSGEPLAVSLSEDGPGPALNALVPFHRHVFYGETYAFTLSYELANVREAPILVTPSYVYLPVIAGGDESTVTVGAPPDQGWTVSLEAEECAQDGVTFTCSGADDAFVAALVEVIRTDAIAHFSFDIPLKERSISLTLSYFQGQEAVSQHLEELVRTALPIIEDIYGFPYTGPPEINISQGGRRQALGYEGLVSCHPSGQCTIVISPAADDLTVLHELSHLWSQIYAKRWLSEGFAHLVAEEAAGALPPGLVQGQPVARQPAAVDLPLDQWGEVASLIGAAQTELEAENAGYDRSLRFLYLLRTEVGSDVLKRVNASIAAEGSAADTEHYLDLVEELSQKRLDHLFADWVYPPSMQTALAARRDARNRLAALSRRVEDEGISEDVLDEVRANVEAWNFDAARTALDDAQANLLEYDELNTSLSRLKAASEAEGLLLPASIADALKRWQFAKTRSLLSQAEDAVDAYAAARGRAQSPRNLWERFGLLGEDPDEKLEAAAAAFTEGDFQTALGRASEASDALADASGRAMRRLLFLGLVFATIAIGIGVAMWMSQQRAKEYADF